MKLTMTSIWHNARTAQIYSGSLGKQNIFKSVTGRCRKSAEKEKNIYLLNSSE